MKEFKLVEYEPKYAKAVADMWNSSKDGWNGEVDHKTEESVLRREEISSHLNFYLTCDGNKVVGYCKLARYFAEEDTLYVDLLNVDPAYHGKKIGKMLVKKSVERTVELGYPRVDLFTWPGNTKAVPMYKKCGFFWEKMETGATHLMNFIPEVLQTELFRDFFKEADWYDDSNREIDLIPDGVSENGFDYLRYSWQKDGKNLLVEYEKTGRGIRKVETDDYSITSSVKKNKLVFGRNYQVNYEIINKSGKKLNVSVKGQKDKNIKTDADFEGNIKRKKTVKAEFYLDEIEVDQSIWKTHPCVKTEITVNGKKVIFRTGINPQFPLKLKATDNFGLTHAELEKDLYLNVENNFDEDCSFEIKFPKLPQIEFLEKKKRIFLKKGERSSIAVKIILHNSVIIDKEIDIKASFTDGKSYSFKQKLSYVMSTYDGKLYGENDHYYYMSFGKFSFSLDKHMDHNQMIYRSIVSDIWSYTGTPKLGRPFSSEFVRKKPYKSEYSETDNSILLKTFYKSDDFPGCEFAINYRMKRSGMLEQWYEMISLPAGLDSVSLSCNFNIERGNVSVPYNGGIMKLNKNEYNDTSLDILDNSKITENWMFSEKDKSTMTVIWPQNYDMKLCSWFLSIEHEFSKKGMMRTEPLIFAVDLFNSVKDVREFALRKEVENEAVTNSFDLDVNSGNPFCEKEIKGSYVDHKSRALDAKVCVYLNTDNSIIYEKTAEKPEKLNKIDFTFEFKGSDPIGIITAEADNYSRTLSKSKAVFVKNKGKVISKETELNGMRILTVKNSSVEMNSSPDFAPSLFSLKFKGREWLATDFPEKVNKSWWNSWFGGITSRPDAMKEINWLAEKSKTVFIKKCDTLGNEWQGIEITTVIEKFDALKGMKVKQYFLMLPGYPVVATYCKVTNRGGFYRKYYHSAGLMFINPDGDLKNIESSAVENGRKITVKGGFEAVDINIRSGLIRYRNIKRKEMLFAFNSDSASKGWSYIDNAVITNSFDENSWIKNGETKIFKPKFIIFSDIDLSEDNLSDLRNIRFKK